jgi:putative heme-binding domain-containing protein
MLSHARRGILVALMIAAPATFPRADEKPADAREEKADTAARVAAIRALGRTRFSAARPLLVKCLGVRQPQPVQLAALKTLGTFDAPGVPEEVLASWPAMTPPLRAAAADALLARPAWRGALLDAVEKGILRPADLGPVRVQLLRQSPDEKLRARAEKLFAGTGPSKRAAEIAKSRKALELKGDAGKGRAVFKESCAACHKFGGVGEAVGPDIAAIKDRTPDSLLVGIVDPNREVLPQYTSYLLVTDDDRILSGMVACETADTLTIRRSDGTAEAVRRSAIQSLRSTGLSAMPEGLEEKIDAQAMADLLAFLAGPR